MALVLVPAVVLAATGLAFADDTSVPTEGLQLELGLFGGGHFFANNLELGVADDPGKVPHPKNGFIFGVRAAATVLPWISFEGEVAGIPSADSFHNYSIFLVSYKTHVLVHLMTGRLRPFVLGGVGWMQVAHAQPSPAYDEIAKDTDFDFHVGVGAKFALTRDLDARFDARAVFLPNTDHNKDSVDPELLLGLAYRFGGESAAPPPPPPPPLVKDTDRDDIPDNVDKCPNDPEDKDGFQDEDGCPDPDNDGDGIPDALDKCPNEPETKNGIDDEDGCPEVDKDGDGIFGSADKCPDAAEDKDGFQDDDGCPDPDNDGDGIPDALDKCPNEPETKNGYLDQDGCPDEIPAAIQKFTGVIKGITFKVKSADIQKSSMRLLGQAVKVLKEYPDLRIEISGHTSSEGVPAKNLKLSQDRADSVKAYLVSAGIAADRVTAVGFGSDKPIADNKTNKGRQQNRRIEFRLLTSDDVAKPGSGAEGQGPKPEGNSEGRLEGKPEGRPEGKVDSKTDGTTAPSLPADEPMPPK
jgi:outer membrane protein OmpA-like peptidoglycan-associated protein